MNHLDKRTRASFADIQIGTLIPEVGRLNLNVKQASRGSSLVQRNSQNTSPKNNSPPQDRRQESTYTRKAGNTHQNGTAHTQSSLALFGWHFFFVVAVIENRKLH